MICGYLLGFEIDRHSRQWIIRLSTTSLAENKLDMGAAALDRNR